MIVGIVGSEAAKFTQKGREQALEAIRQNLTYPGVTGVASGACHLGGIDIWAVEIGRELGLRVLEFPPKEQSWNGGYKQRNIQIAKASDLVWCITVDKLPPDYRGMCFSHCYHCESNTHVKSGGCWTAKYAKRLGKPAGIIVVTND